MLIFQGVLQCWSFSVQPTISSLAKWNHISPRFPWNKGHPISPLHQTLTKIGGQKSVGHVRSRWNFTQISDKNGRGWTGIKSSPQLSNSRIRSLESKSVMHVSSATRRKAVKSLGPKVGHKNPRAFFGLGKQTSPQGLKSLEDFRPGQGPQLVIPLPIYNSHLVGPVWTSIPWRLDDTFWPPRCLDGKFPAI